MAVDKNSLALVRQGFANAAFAHKVHEVAVERKETRATKFKAANISIVALVVTLLVIQATVSKNNNVLIYISSGVGAAEIILLIVDLSFNAEREAVSHKNMALEYMALRDNYKELMADILGERISASEITKRRTDLLGEYQRLSKLALQTTENDYDNALSKLNIRPDKQNAWSDKQIDNLLPKELRLVK